MQSQSPTTHHHLHFPPHNKLLPSHHRCHNPQCLQHFHSFSPPSKIPFFVPPTILHPSNRSLHLVTWSGNPPTDRTPSQLKLLSLEQSLANLTSIIPSLKKLHWIPLFHFFTSDCGQWLSHPLYSPFTHQLAHLTLPYFGLQIMTSLESDIQTLFWPHKQKLLRKNWDIPCLLLPLPDGHWPCSKITWTKLHWSSP